MNSMQPSTRVRQSLAGLQSLQGFKFKQKGKGRTVCGVLLYAEKKKKRHIIQALVCA